MTRFTIDTEYVLDAIRIDDLGIGIPFLFFVASVLLVLWSIPGITNIDMLTGYGKFGLSIVLLGAMLCLIATGYTYHELDFSLWLWVKERDGFS